MAEPESSSQTSSDNEHPPWKLIASHVSEQHRVQGDSAYYITPEEGEGLIPIDITTNERALILQGRQLPRSFIRRWFYENRRWRRLEQPGAFVWSTFYPGENTSIMGLALYVRPETAARYLHYRTHRT